VLAVVLTGIAGKNPRSALAMTAGWLIILAILVALVCTTAALWRWLRKDKHNELRQPVPGNQNDPAGPGRLTF
jgi:sensor domain CHASE-containing protein